MTTRSEAVLAYLKKRFPNPRCGLVFHNPFECLVSIALSAQTTDVSVNKVTPILFEKFPDAFSMSKAPISEIEDCIKSLGLYRNKAKSIQSLSQCLVEKYGGEVPRTKAELVKLPGVGNKTAGVFLLEIERVPAIPVDTHITRIAERLGYAKAEIGPDAIEKKLEKAFPKEEHIYLHHALIWFGREICHAKNPQCGDCELQGYCAYFKKSSLTKGK